MAARIRARHQDEIREKIRASQLVNALENHALGKREMASTQVTAALGLLKKCVPDIAAIEHTGKDGGPIETKDVSNEDLARWLGFELAKKVQK